jgi:hypothetical protein
MASCASGSNLDEDAASPYPSSTAPAQQQSAPDSSVNDSTVPTDDAPATTYGDGYVAPTTNPSPGDAGVSTGQDAGEDAAEEAAAEGPTCGPGQTCVDIVPQGWSGYVQLVLQSGDAGTGCAAPYPTDQPQLAGQTNPDGGPATCGTCTCSVPEAGITCSIELLTGDLLCLGGSSAPMTALTQNTCVQISGFGTSANGGSTQPTATSGTCEAQGGAMTAAPPASTSTLATVCATADGGAPSATSDGGSGMTCMPTQACAAVPASSPGSPSGACIYQQGAQDCPVGSVFSAQYLVGAIDDSRGCGCFCGAPSCPGDGYVSGYNSNNCSGPVAITIDAGSKCKAALNETSFMYYPSHSGSRGTCEVEDAGPTGAVTIDAGTATTFCCIP